MTSSYPGLTAISDFAQTTARPAPERAARETTPEAAAGPAAVPHDDLAEAVADVIFRMHLDHNQEQPTDANETLMLLSWREHLAQSGVPAPAVPMLYHRAVQAKAQTAGRGFMPTIGELLHQWQIALDNGYWEKQNAPESAVHIPALPPGAAPLAGGINTDSAPEFVRAFARFTTRGAAITCHCPGDRWCHNGHKAARLTHDSRGSFWVCAEGACDFSRNANAIQPPEPETSQPETAPEEATNPEPTLTNPESPLANPEPPLANTEPTLTNPEPPVTTTHQGETPMPTKKYDPSRRRSKAMPTGNSKSHPTADVSHTIFLMPPGLAELMMPQPDPTRHHSEEELLWSLRERCDFDTDLAGRKLALAFARHLATLAPIEFWTPWLARTQWEEGQREVRRQKEEGGTGTANDER